MVVDVKRYRDLQSAEIEEWKRLVEKAHPAGEVRLGQDLLWADLDAETDYLIRLRDDDALLACAWVTRRTISVADREMRVAGVRGVTTDPERRRHGHGRAIMERAHVLMRSFADCGFALLFSSVMAVPFYESLGWHAVAAPVICDQPGRPHRLHPDPANSARHGACVSRTSGSAARPDSRAWSALVTAPASGLLLLPLHLRQQPKHDSPHRLVLLKVDQQLPDSLRPWRRGDAEGGNLSARRVLLTPVSRGATL
jgi:GNAT superfamily N-acetyltransferase